MEKINWTCKEETLNNTIVWVCHPKKKEHFESTNNTVQLFTAINYGGNTSSFDLGNYNSSQLLNIGPNALKSIKVPPGLEVLLYQNDNFTGYGKSIITDTPDLSVITDSQNSSFNWSNQMKSFIVQTYFPLPTSISGTIPKIALVSPDPNSFITIVPGAKMTKIDGNYYLYSDPKNENNIYWYHSSDLQVMPPFDLNTISRLTVWYDATDPLNNGSLPADGDSITTWYDKSTNKYDLTNYGYGNKPIFKMNAVNSLPSLSFSDGYTVMTSNVLFDTTADSTVFVVCLFNNDAYGSRFSHSMNQNFPTTSVTISQLNNPARITHSADPGNHQWYKSLPVTLDSVTILKSTTVNGIATTFQQINSTGTSSISFDQSGFQPQTGKIWLGGQADMYGMYGYMCEVIYYQSALSTQQQYKVESYLAWKWGLQNNLSDNNPYKNVQPNGR